MHIGGWDIDVVDQRLARLFLIAFVIVGGHEAIVTPEQVDLRPVDPVGLLADPFEQPGPRTAAGEHDECAAPLVDRIGDRRHQPVSGSRHQSGCVRVLLDDSAHTYCTFSIPSSASW